MPQEHGVLQDCPATPNRGVQSVVIALASIGDNRITLNLAIKDAYINRDSQIEPPRNHVPVGVIHGRFQGLHFGHMEYLLAGKRRCDFLFVGLCNPDPTSRTYHTSDPNRSRADNNPFSYHERMVMTRASLVEAGVALEDFAIVPFPINKPELLHHYVPMDATFFVTIYDQWGHAKRQTLLDLDVAVDVMWEHESALKPCTGTEVRQRIIAGENWRELVPDAVVRYVVKHRLDARLRELHQLAMRQS